MMKQLYTSFVFLTVIVASDAQPADNRPRPAEKVVAILGAFDEEVKLLQESVQNRKEQTVGGIRFVSGRLNGKPVVIAQTGIGKVNAAMTTTLALMHFRPSSVLFTGIAGGVNPDLNPGDLVIARSTAHHDYESITFDRKPTRQTRNAVTYGMNPAFFPADSLLLLYAEAVAGKVKMEPPRPGGTAPRVVTGIVVTGDQFISSAARVEQLRATFNADATEMEGAAVAQVCHQQKVPCLVIRSLSDKADENARNDMLSFYKTAARNSAALVVAIIAEMP
jgi:adenosylhomocysteine nucleosidase